MNASSFPPFYWLQLLGLAAAYVLIGHLSLDMMVSEGLASLVWPPSGISVAALLLFGFRLWPGIAAGAFITALSVTANPIVAIGIAFGNTLEAVLALWLTRRAFGNRPLFNELRTTLVFICAGLIAPAVAAGVGASALVLTQEMEPALFARTWGLWWLGDLIGILTLTPALYLTGKALQQREHEQGPTFDCSLPEQVLVICLATLVSVIAYTTAGEIGARLNYLPFIFVLWGALRFPLLQALLLSLTVATLAISGTLADPATAPEQVIDELVFLYLFLAVQTVTVLLVGAMVREREGMARELILAQQRAIKASQQKSQFLTNISHEIRTPVNGIIGVAGLMTPDAKDERQREQLRIIQSSADSLLNLLNDLLDHARIEAGKLHIDRHAFYLPQLVRDVVGLFESQAEARGLTLKAILDGDLPRCVVSDAHRIRQVLVNTLGNALKFTRQGSIILRVSLTTQHQWPPRVLFEVEDTGIGIPAEALDRIFEPFTQADSSTSRLYGGSGLGLTISRQLVAYLGGTLALSSRPGQGTRVEVTLPLRPASESEEQRCQAGNSRRELETGRRPSLVLGRRILVAEDNLINAQVTEHMLRNLGHDVTVAHDGERVIAAWQQGFDLILMDCLMPIMDGYSATRAIRKLEQDCGSRIPIIALTANAMNDERERCLAAGMDDYLAKPIRIHQLEGMLRKHLLKAPS